MSKAPRKQPSLDSLGIFHHNVPTDAVGPVEEERQADASTNSDNEHQRMIAEAAYYRAERSGFEAGHELEDWLAAEAEIVTHSLEQKPSESETH